MQHVGVVELTELALAECRASIRAAISREVPNPFVRARIYKRLASDKARPRLGEVAMGAAVSLQVMDARLAAALQREIKDQEAVERIRDTQRAELLRLGTVVEGSR